MKEEGGDVFRLKYLTGDGRLGNEKAWSMSKSLMKTHRLGSYLQK